jgi:DNA invertase Pin-like site-specific DNA recombinase
MTNDVKAAGRVRAYIRVSHIDSAESNLSPETQATLVRQRWDREVQQWGLLGRTGDPPRWANDGWSGTKKAGQETTDGLYIDRAVSAFKVPLELRPAGRLLLAAMRPGDTLIVAYPDRVFRSGRDWADKAAAWHRQGIRLIFCSPDIDYASPSGKLILDIMMAVAEFQSRLMSERNREIIRELKRQGRVYGKTPGLGYKRHHKLSKKLVANNEERRDVYLIAALHQQGFTLQAISDMLESRDAKREGREPVGEIKWNKKTEVRRWTRDAVWRAWTKWKQGLVPPPEDEPLPDWYRPYAGSQGLGGGGAGEDDED